MHHPFIIGEKLYLRGLETSDLEGEYFDWLNDREVTKFLDSGAFPNTPERLEEYYRSVALSPNNVMLAIIDKESDKHIGNIRLGPINWITRIAPLGIMIGNKEFWGKGYATEAIQLILEYAFKRLNLHKVNAGIVAIHQASIRAFEKAGFKIEGQARSQFYLDGDYYDSLYLGITKEDLLGKSSSG
jgi:RimJ/RimL family protein N-acetyltransferase